VVHGWYSLDTSLLFAASIDHPHLAFLIYCQEGLSCLNIRAGSFS